MAPTSPVKIPTSKDAEFPAHGQARVRFTGQIVRLYVEGPWNREFVVEVRVTSDRLDDELCLAGGSAIDGGLGHSGACRDSFDAHAGVTVGDERVEGGRGDRRVQGGIARATGLDRRGHTRAGSGTGPAGAPASACLAPTFVRS